MVDDQGGEHELPLGVVRADCPYCAGTGAGSNDDSTGGDPTPNCPTCNGAGEILVFADLKLAERVALDRLQRRAGAAPYGLAQTTGADGCDDDATFYATPAPGEQAVGIEAATQQPRARNAVKVKGADPECQLCGGSGLHRHPDMLTGARSIMCERCFPLSSTEDATKDRGNAVDGMADDDGMQSGERRLRRSYLDHLASGLIKPPQRDDLAMPPTGDGMRQDAEGLDEFDETQSHLAAALTAMGSGLIGRYPDQMWHRHLQSLALRLFRKSIERVGGCDHGAVGYGHDAALIWIAADCYRKLLDDRDSVVAHRDALRVGLDERVAAADATEARLVQAERQIEALLLAVDELAEALRPFVGHQPSPANPGTTEPLVLPISAINRARSLVVLRDALT